MNLDQLYLQKLAYRWNEEINRSFNQFSLKHSGIAKWIAPYAILIKSLINSSAIFLNMVEYTLRGLFFLGRSLPIKNYFSTLGSFTVILTFNVATLVPDILIRSYLTIRDGKIKPEHTLHTLFYKLSQLI
jgi:hypothetical protein